MHIVRIKSDGLLRHGSIMVASGLSVGVLNYLYQLSMSVILTPAEYGTLFSLTSLFNMVILFSRTFQISVAKFTSKFKVEEKWGRINYLWRHSLKHTLLLGSGIFLASALFSPVLSGFLNIDNYWYVPILFSSLTLAFALPVNQGMLQGLERFLHLGFANALLALLRLAIGVVLVYLGFGLYGGLIAYPIAYIVIFIITLSLVRDIGGIVSEKFEASALTSYTGLTFLAIFSFATLTNMDIVLVKHFLSAEDAGSYAAISVLGKIALFAPAGIGIAMFPKTSGFFETGVKTGPILRKALVSVLLIAGSVVIVYWLFSGFIVNYLYGDKYPLVTSNLVKYGLAMALFAVSYLLMNYLLSLNQTRAAYCFLGGMLLELGLIFFLHSGVAQVVNMMLISGAFCLTLVLLCYAIVRHGLSKRR